MDQLLFYCSRGPNPRSRSLGGAAFAALPSGASLGPQALHCSSVYQEVAIAAPVMTARRR
jgi:hypothetical protein